MRLVLVGKTVIDGDAGLDPAYAVALLSRLTAAIEDLGAVAAATGDTEAPQRLNLRLHAATEHESASGRVL